MQYSRKQNLTNMLQKYGLEPKSLDLSSLRQQYTKLLQKKGEVSEQLKSLEKEINATQKKIDNISQYTGIEQNNVRHNNKHKEHVQSL